MTKSSFNYYFCVSSLLFSLLFSSSVAFQLSTSTSLRKFLPRQNLITTQLSTTVNGEESSETTASTNKNAVLESSSPFFTISKSNTGPSQQEVHRLTFHSLPGQTSNPETTEMNHHHQHEHNNNSIVIETGKIGRQASGAVTLTRGESVLYVTASRDKDAKEDIDFLPLSVEHQERFSSAGMTSGAFNRRDGRPAEHEILTCRLIDRPIRPLIQPGWRHETQILSWVLSYDGQSSCDPLAILASSAALCVSDIPLTKPIAAVQVGMAEGEEPTFILNPTHKQMETSKLHLTVAGTQDAVLMIEGAADFLPEETFIEAVKFGHEAIQVLCQGLDALSKTLGVEKYLDTIKLPPENLQARVDEVMTERVDEMLSMTGNKISQGKAMSQLSKSVVEELSGEFPEQSVAIKGAFKDLLSRRMFIRAKNEGLRYDGRGLNEIRRIDIETGFLPRVHGSALFTRGETQAIATATLGDSSMRQKIDKIGGMEEKRFYLQYSFPPSSVGETGRVGAPGRREVGHGNLAERALIPILPTEKEFPYSIRVESLITESNGSSSMASVCGGCLSLMDAGVPISRPVAGIAMGMLLGDKAGVSDDNAVILSDILGTEDALGTMDFKVAGDKEGISTFQLDIKCEGLTLETMQKALEQAREGRMHILGEMEKVLSKPRESLPDTVPKMLSFNIPYESIGKIIGPGGKQIRSIIEDFELEGMDVSDDGQIQMSSFNVTKMSEAQAFSLNLIGGSGNGDRKERAKYEGPEPVVGEVYTGPIKGIHPFGVFVEILPGAEDGSTPGLEGLVHVSELARERVRNCEGFMKSMAVEELTVKYLGMEKGKIKLSRKAVLEDKSNGKESPKQSPQRDQSLTTMSKEELDVIAKAIEGVQDA